MTITSRFRKKQSDTELLLKKQRGKGGSWWSIQSQASVCGESRWSSTDSTDDLGLSFSEPVCVDEYLPIESSCTDIEWAPILETEKEEEVEIDVDDSTVRDGSVIDVKPQPSSNERMDRMESVVQHLMQRQDEICDSMKELLASAAKPSLKMRHRLLPFLFKKNTPPPEEDKKSHDLIEQQKRIAALFAYSLKAFGSQLDKKVTQSEKQAKQIKHLKTDLAEKKQALRELSKEIAKDKFLASMRLLTKEESEASLQPEGDPAATQNDCLARMVQEKEDELNEAKAIINDLVEQLRDAEEEIDFCAQRERESAMAMQAVMNCTIADQRSKIDDLNEQLAHLNVALTEAKSRSAILQRRLDRRFGKRADSKGVVEDDSSRSVVKSSRRKDSV